MPQRKERLLHHVIVQVFVKPHERMEEVLAGLDILSPVPCQELLAQEPEHDPERPHTTHYRMTDTTLTVQETMGDEGRMRILTLFFRRMSAVNAFAHRLKECLTAEELAEYLNNLSLLLDAHGKLSVRLDKELLKQGRLSLTEDGQCYKVKASIAAYPKSEERILVGVKRVLTP